MNKDKYTLWHGIYEYSIENYLEDEIGFKPVQFYLLVYEKDLQNFTGFAYDLNGGIKCQALINGYFDDNRISFEKRYNYYDMFDEEKRIHVSNNYKPLTIYYDGKLTSKNEFKGDWRCGPGTINYLSEIYKSDFYTGNFSLKRKY